LIPEFCPGLYSQLAMEILELAAEEPQCHLAILYKAGTKPLRGANECATFQKTYPIKKLNSFVEFICRVYLQVAYILH
jgi:hypothetical protein